MITTAIWKEPVAGRVPVRGVNLDGDDQADRTVHGGPDKAIYAYAAEDIAWWAERRGADLGPAPFGENLTTIGVDVSDARIGERWAIGSTLLEVRQSRMPCFKLGLRHRRSALRPRRSHRPTGPAPTSASSKRGTSAPVTPSRSCTGPTTT